jgi:hypothetical protein
MTSYFSEVYIDNTLARVEIGNASTFAACTHREIQIPTKWSGTSVTVTVNRGSFAVGNTVYLYVVDASGVTNSNGYAMTIQDATSAPSPPENLHIVHD